MDLRDLAMAKLTFIFSDPQFLANAEAHFTDPYIQNIWERGNLRVFTDEKTGLCIHSMNILLTHGEE